MDLQQAAALIGIDLDSSPDPRDIRRAYLRETKKTKPEVDPTGFSQLREAYELLSMWAQYGMPPPVAPSIEDDTQNEPIADTSASELNVVADSPAHEPELLEHEEHDVAREHRELGPYYERLDALPDEATWQDRAKIAREALTSHPENLYARHLLLSVLPTDDNAARVEARKVMRQGIDLGQMEWFASLVRNFPMEVPEQGLKTAVTSTDPDTLLAAAEVLLDGRPEQSLAILDSTTKTIAKRGATNAHLEDVLRVVLAAYGKSGDEIGERALSLADENLEFAHLDWLRIPQGASFYWGVITELRAAKSLLPDRVRRQVALDTLWDSHGHASIIMAELANHYSIVKRVNLRRRLEECAPTILHMIDDGITSPPAQPPPHSGNVSWGGTLIFRLIWFGAVFFFIFGKGCS